MKITNFQLKERLGSNALSWRFRGTVDITTGFFRRRTETAEIYSNYGGNWYFTATGKFTPGFEVENLVRAFEAKHRVPIERTPLP